MPNSLDVASVIPDHVEVERAIPGTSKSWHKHTPHLTAVPLVHHARKGAAHARAGQALRGSSELQAWGDSNLYLRRRGDTLCLAIEHRAAPSRDGLVVELRTQGEALALHVVDGAPTSARVLTPPGDRDRAPLPLDGGGVPALAFSGGPSRLEGLLTGGVDYG